MKEGIKQKPRATLSQERSRQTRRTIIAAAETLWLARSFDAVSVDDVCAEAGVAKGTFYFYFPTKEHLLVTLVFTRASPGEEEITQLLASSRPTVEICWEVTSLIARRVAKLPRALIQRGVEAGFQLYREVSVLAGHSQGWRELMEPIFTRGLARAEVAPDWHPSLVASAFSWGLVQGLLAWSMEPDGRPSPQPHLWARAELVVNGAAAPKQAVGRRKRAPSEG